MCEILYKMYIKILKPKSNIAGGGLGFVLLFLRDSYKVLSPWQAFVCAHGKSGKGCFYVCCPLFGAVMGRSSFWNISVPLGHTVRVVQW